MKKIGLAVFFLFLPSLLFPQSGKLRGVVTDKDSGTPLPGANVTVVDSQMGAVSDIHGDYILLAVQPGIYSVRAEYVGYQTVTVSNIRINTILTTTLNFKLEPTESKIESFQLAAKRPIVQQNTTNTFRVFNQEDIRNLPIRGLENIIALNTGTVVQDGKFHIRGGRSGEINYLINGSTATSPFTNSLTTFIIQEAIEEIQMQTGGFTAEYGGANSAIVNTTIRTGGERLRGTIDYRTDDFAKGGDTFLGTTSRGYHNIVGTIGGPFPYFPKLKFFLAGQYNFARNRSAVFIEPFTFDPVNNNLPLWNQKLWNQGKREFYAPWFVEDGLYGRANSVGDPLTDENGNVVPFKFEQNFLPNNDTRSFSANGTLVYDWTNSIKLKMTGSYNFTRQPQGWNNFYNAVNNYYSNMERRTDIKQGLLNLQTTHIINPRTFYDVGLHWSTQKTKYYDPRFGDDWIKYADSREWEKAGLDASQWRDVFVGPADYSAIFIFNFIPPNSVESRWDDKNYQKSSQKNIGMSLDFTTQLTSNLEIKLGGRFDKWIARSWGVNSATYLYYMNPNNWDRNWKNDHGVLEGLWTEEYIRTLSLDKYGSIDSYGWDIMGENKVDDGPYGPQKPTFASSYLQTKWEHGNLVLNLGVRWEHHAYNALKPKKPEQLEYDPYNLWINVEDLVHTKSYTYILPRINLAFLLSEKTVMFAQFGKYVQSGSLNNVYQSIQSLSDLIPERRNVLGTSVNYFQKPERNDQYELGIRQALSENFSFTATAFYKNMYDLIGAGRLYSSRGKWHGVRIFGAYVNDDIAIARGLELTLELHRWKRMSTRVFYTLSKVRGTSSNIHTNEVINSDVVIAMFPSYLYPLSYNQTHRGTVMFDYRFLKGDGGKIFEGLGINLLFTFNSGHAYTKIEELTYLGGSATPWTVGVQQIYDNRFSRPTEPINSSSTPWKYNIDLSLEKMFYFNRFNVTFYTNVLNVLNTKNIINVFQNTGTDNDNSWFKHPLSSYYTNIDGYEAFYRTINLVNGWGYQWATGTELWGRPRQIRFGIMVEIK